MPPRANRPPNAKPVVPTCFYCGSDKLSRGTPRTCLACGRFSENVENVTLVCPVCNKQTPSNLSTVGSEITCDGCKLTIAVADFPCYNP